MTMPRYKRILLKLSGEALMGDSVEWQEGMALEISGVRLKKDDILRVVSQKETTNAFQAPEDGRLNLSIPVATPGFIRVEIYRHFLMRTR